jgi:hypothetical protein
VPFALFHEGALGIVSTGPLHSLSIYLGFTTNSQEMRSRSPPDILINEMIRSTIPAIFIITIFENVTQFIIVYLEIFLYKTTVTFIQAGFPIITLCMISKAMANLLADSIYMWSEDF